jgi:hypothetical protein
MFSKLSNSGLKYLIIGGFAVSGLILAHAIKQILTRRKYRHIKGPSTKGYIYLLHSIINIKINFYIDKQKTIAPIRHKYWY